MAELFDYQIEGIKHLKDRSACLFDAPGLGKTVQAIKANVEASERGPILVITPLRNKIFFAASILHWTGVSAEGVGSDEDPEVIVTETAGRFDVDHMRECLRLRKRVWVVTHWGALSQPASQALVPVYWAGVIVDEAHRMRDRGTQQTAFVSHVLKAHHFHFLTATPKDKHPGELWPMLFCCDRAKFVSYWNFYNEWVETKPQYTRAQGGGRKVINVPTGTKNPAGLAKVLKPYILGRTKTEVGHTLPVLTSTVDVSLNDLTAAYDQLEEQTYIQALGEQKLHTPLYLPNQLSRLIRLQQLISHPPLVGVSHMSPKLEWLQEFLEGMPTDTPVLVFTKFRDTAQHIARTFTHAQVVVGGGPTWNGWRKGVNVLVVTYGTLSEGVNLDKTLDGRTVSYVVFYDTQWSSIVQEQSINRVHRITTTVPVNLYQLRGVRLGGRKTIDDDILATLDSKAGDSGLVQMFLRRLGTGTGTDD